MAVTRHEVRSGAYFDSVVLMQLQKALAELPGVRDAGVVMATPANCELLTASGFALETITAGPDDLLIMVTADDEGTATGAIAQVDELLRRRRSADVAQSFRPRSLATAAQQLPAARWVLVSVPGRYAASVAEEALELGKHVFLYSDNVPLDDEVRLKQKAREKGLLLMGPDCGTAIVNGVGLGFANRVRRGPIGLVAASGTGLQAITVAIHNQGGGVSQALGTGGRDLKAEVGGISTLQALDLLRRDPQTEVVVLVSKPPDPAVARQVLGAALHAQKPVVVCYLGYAPPARRLGDLYFAAGLEDAAKLAAGLSQQPAPPETSITRNIAGGYMRGLFSGGTLAYEALLALQELLQPLYSNVATRPEQRLADSFRSQGHTIVDLGEDEFTQGRLHPMMDNDLRLRRLQQEAADPETGLILLDVVLGEGAHPDPSAELAPAIRKTLQKRDDLELTVLLVGTDEDPQGLDLQAERLHESGASVFHSSAEALAYVARRLAPAPTPPASELPLADFQGELAAINVGLESFYDSLQGQGATAVQVAWRPPAGGNEKLMGILARMKRDRH